MLERLGTAQAGPPVVPDQHAPKMSDPSSIMVSMNRLSTERGADRRLPGRGQLDPRHRPHDRRGEEHIAKLLVDLGAACTEYQDGALGT